MAFGTTKKKVLIDIELQSDKARLRADVLKRSIAELEKVQKKQNKALKDSIKVGEEASKKSLKRAAALNKTQTELRNARKEYNLYTREINKGNGIFKKAETRSNSLAKSFASMGAKIMAMVGGFRLLTREIGYAVRDYALFEKTLANVQTLLEHNEQTLRKGAIDVMQKYGFAIQDVNKALFDAISAGIPATEAIRFLNDSAKLAVGGVTDLKTSVDGLTSVLNAYSLGTEYAAEVSDAFYVAQKYGKTTVQDLVNNIGRVAPIAKIAGVSFQTMLGSLASLTKGGLNTEESVTILRQAIAALIKPAVQAKLVLKDASVPVGIMAIKTKGLVFALEQLNKAYEENPDVVAQAIPNIRAFTGIAAFSAERLEELKTIIGDVEGDHTSLTRALEEQMGTLSKLWDVAKSKVRAWRIEITEKLTPGLKELLRVFNDWADTSISPIQAQTDAIANLRKELEVIQVAGYTADQRALAIKDINEEYAAYLPYLIEEEATLEDIARLQGMITEEMQARILAAQYEAELKQVYDDEAQAIITLRELKEQDAKSDNQAKLDSIQLTERQRKVLKENYEITSLDITRLGNATGKKWEEINLLQKSAVKRIYWALRSYSEDLVTYTDQNVDHIQKKYEKLMKDIGYDLGEFLKKVDEADKDPKTDKTHISLADRERIAAATLAIQRKMEDQSIAILKNGAYKKMLIEEKRHKRNIEDLEKQIIKEREIEEGVKLPLAKEELALNKAIFAALQQEEEVHVKNVEELASQAYEARVKWFNKWLRDNQEASDKEKERAAKEKESEARRLLAYRKRYGLEDTFEQYRLDLKAFEENEFFKTLTVEEQEQARDAIRRKYMKQYYDLAIDSARTVSNAVFDMLQQSSDRDYESEYRLLEEKNDAQLQILNNRLDKQLISEEQYEQASTFLAEKNERKRREIEKRQFEEKKDRDTAQAIINGALAITKTFAEYGFTVYGIAAAVAQGIETLAQIAVIQSAKYALGKGPETDGKGTVIQGTGTWNSDNIPVLVSPGEAIINAKSMADPLLRAQASAINVAGGGRPFAYGGIPSPMAAAAIPADSSLDIIQALKSMPAPVVYVDEIRRGIANKTEVEVKAII